MKDPIVSIKQGRLRGIIEENVDEGQFYSFKGIPYAKPPVGDLRFRDPEPPESWSGIRDASKHGPSCPQQDMITRTIIGSEDCLYLNIYTESIDNKILKPVMVWIHGGGFSTGSGNDDLYGPDYLVKSDIILVTINYRLGAFGFLNLDHEVAPGNQGLKDQVQALVWIRDNIESFGGDPNNVTIFGESAGGASVHYLTLSPLADGLFHKAISQSGVAVNPWAKVWANPDEFAYRLSDSLGRKSFDPVTVVEFLRTVDSHKLVKAQQKLLTPEEKIQSVRPFGPGMDIKSKNPFLSKPLSVAMRIGTRVPFILGYNSHEGIFSLAGFTEATFKKIDADFEKCLHPSVLTDRKAGRMTSEEIRNYYYGGERVSRKNAEKYAAMWEDVNFINGIQDVVDIQGTTHTDDLPYLFYSRLLKKLNFGPPKFGSTERKVIQRFTQMWSDFAKSGNPTPVTSDLIPVTWRPVGRKLEMHYLEITEDLKMGINPDIERRLVWNEIRHKL
ncbi:esterase FE4 isoform X2 [Cephus cinctus]|uniref:Carboxylic ester hydrolase n=1 Tax=Cephus cinctus TaxID=211228 RepID=A0AAJ7CAE3_CEPCN|nr:esterase FE4 isoform X2 [Cephus cinctus]